MVINVFVSLDFMKKQTGINNITVITKKIKYKNFSFYKSPFFLLRFVEILSARIFLTWTIFVVSIILSQVITESSIILAKYLPFSQVHLAGFQI